jgi:putative tryptophan/tyrosine transport system substrate-binding protein
MRRRSFLSALGVSAVWPWPAIAQRPAETRHIGVLMALAGDDALRASYVGALQAGLRESGWIEGKNIEIDYRWAGPNPDQMRQLARELVALRPALIIAHTSPATIAVLSETTTTPIVFVTVVEPVAQGFVKSLAHPGGNATGFMNFEFSMGGKWIEILREILPQVSQARVIFNPDTAPGNGNIFLRSIEAGARSFSIAIEPTPVRNSREIATTIASLGQSSDTGLIVPPDIFLTANRAMIVELTAQFRLPTIYQYDFFVRDGGLVSYGVDFPDLFRQSAVYVDQILKGALPADLPVQSPATFRLAINLKTAKALGLNIPPTLLIRADEVIE